jgi:hypothetical protein
MIQFGHLNHLFKEESIMCAKLKCRRGLVPVGPDEVHNHYSTTDSARHQRIRRWARDDELVAMRRRGMWFFGDYSNCLRSPEQGLSDEEAEQFLLQD